MPLARALAPGHAEGDGILRAQDADADRPLAEEPVGGQERFVFIDVRGHRLQEGVALAQELLRQVVLQAAGADETGHHPRAGDLLEEIEQHLPLAEAVEEGAERAEVDRLRAEPDEMAGEATQLAEQDADHPRPLGNLHLHQPLDGERVGEIHVQRREVVDAIGQRDGLPVGLALHRLLDAGVQVADLRLARKDRLAVQFEDEPQDAVRARMLRPHVDLHPAGGSRQWASGQ